MANELASSGTYGLLNPVQLFAGEKEVVTTHDLVAVSQDLAQYQVVAKNADGDLVAHDPDAVTGSPGSEVPAPESKAVGVLAVAVKTDGTTKQSAPYFVSAFFNHEVLVWDADLDTLAKRKAAFVGTEIQVGTLYGAA